MLESHDGSSDITSGSTLLTVHLSSGGIHAVPKMVIPIAVSRMVVVRMAELLFDGLILICFLSVGITDRTSSSDHTGMKDLGQAESS